MVDVSNMPTTCPICGGTGKAQADSASRLTWLRNETGLTQEEFAKRVGATRASIANMESGRHGPTAQKIIAIAREFEVSADWLLGLR